VSKRGYPMVVTHEYTDAEYVLMHRADGTPVMQDAVTYPIGRRFHAPTKAWRARLLASGNWADASD